MDRRVTPTNQVSGPLVDSPLIAPPPARPGAGSSSHGQPTVDAQRGARDKRGGVGGEEGDCGRDVLRRAQAPQRGGAHNDRPSVVAHA